MQSNSICLLLVLAGSVLMPACSPSTNNQPNQNENGTVKQNENGDPGVSRELTTQEAEAVLSAARQTETSSAASSAASYARQTDETGGRVSIQQFNDCPMVESGIDADTQQATVALGFGDGCAPVLYPDVTVSGSIGGTVTLAPLTLSLEFASFSVGGDTIDGDIELTFVKSAGSVGFTGDMDLITASGGSVTLDSAQWTLDTASGVVTLSGSGVGEESDGDVYLIKLDAVVIDGQGNGNFIPESGSVTVTLRNADLVFGPDSTSLQMTFTSQTPATGIVLLSVNGAGAIEYQTGLAP
jgi:hypothetical protein